MARARNIKPGFYKNEDLAECSVWARFIFPGLWMLADREGRLEDRPKRIKGELLPFDTVEVEPLLRELEARNFIVRYEVGGVRAIQIMAFKAHQTPHYSEKASGIKPPAFLEFGAHEPPQDSKKADAIKGGPQPPDCLNPDSLNPEPRAKRGARGSRLPADWVPSEELQAWAEAERPDVDLPRCLAEFRDYWIGVSGSKGVKADWDATFRNSVRSDRAPLKRVNGASSSLTRDEWWKSEVATDRKARELHMTARGGESYASLRERIFERLRETAHA